MTAKLHSWKVQRASNSRVLLMMTKKRRDGKRRREAEKDTGTPERGGMR
jgi:hypothetical protein